MENGLSRSIDIAKDKAQYDQLCKMILANKTVLAWIMRRTVKEYAGMTIEDKKQKLETEYQMPMESELRKGLNLMCNLRS